MQYNATDKDYFVENCNDLVIWSGGLDSTLILHDLLKKSSEERPVGALSLNHYFLQEGKFDGESKMREKFIAEVVSAKKYPFSYDFISFNGATNHPVYNGTGQITTWIMYAHSVANRNATIHLGVLKTDEQARHLPNLYKLVELLNEITDKKVKLSFPLIKYSKLDVISQMFENNLEKLVWICEHPKKKTVDEVDYYKQCGGISCNSCKEHMENLILYRIANSDNTDILERIESHLKSLFDIEFTSYNDLKKYLKGSLGLSVK